MKIRSVGAELFHRAVGQRLEEANSCFSKFCECAHNTIIIIIVRIHNKEILFIQLVTHAYLGQNYMTFDTCASLGSI